MGYDSDKDVQLEIITQQLEWEASTIAELYKARWDVEIFCQVKQNLLVKTFTGYKRKCGQGPDLYRPHYLFYYLN